MNGGCRKVPSTCTTLGYCKWYKYACLRDEYLDPAGGVERGQVGAGGGGAGRGLGARARHAASVAAHAARATH